MCSMPTNGQGEKYSNLSENHHFGPIGIETYSACRPRGIKLMKQIGKTIQEAIAGKLSTF